MDTRSDDEHSLSEARIGRRHTGLSESERSCVTRAVREVGMSTLAEPVSWILVAATLAACSGCEKNRPPAGSAESSDPSASSDQDGSASESQDDDDGLLSSLGAVQGSEGGARALLAHFLEPTADHAALTSGLRPTPDDYNAIFDPQTAAKVEAAQAKEWDSLMTVVKPKPGHTEIRLWTATGAELAEGTGDSKEFPAEYGKIAKHLAPSLPVFRFKFVAPGKATGKVYDGLVFVNGHWVMVPKPWRAMGVGDKAQHNRRALGKKR